MTLQQYGEVVFISLDKAADADFSLVGKSTKPTAVTYDPVDQVGYLKKEKGPEWVLNMADACGTTLDHTGPSLKTENHQVFTGICNEQLMCFREIIS